MNWKEILCLDERANLMLPDDWNRPTSEIVEKIFPYKQKPQEIFVSLDLQHILTLNILEKVLQEEQVYPALLEIQRLIVHMYPESIRETSTLIKTEAGIAGYFSFITGGIKYDNCRYMFVLPIRGKMMMGSYHFPDNLSKENRLIFFEVLKYIKPSEDTEEEK